MHKIASLYISIYIYIYVYIYIYINTYAIICDLYIYIIQSVCLQGLSPWRRFTPGILPLHRIKGAMWCNQAISQACKLQNFVLFFKLPLLLTCRTCPTQKTPRLPLSGAKNLRLTSVRCLYDIAFPPTRLQTSLVLRLTSTRYIHAGLSRSRHKAVCCLLRVMGVPS